MTSPAAASEDWLAVVLGLLRADAPGTVMEAPENWPRWAVLLPHVLAATGHFEHRPGPREQPGMTETAWLPDRAAVYLQVQARLGEALPLAERALAIDEAAYGPDHPEVGTDLNNLAQIWQDLGQLERARPLAERALAITEAAHGPDHPTVGTRLNNLAVIWQDLGQLEQARPLAERALAITEAAYGPDHPAVGTRLNNLAQIWQDLGQPEKARPLAERALAITEAAYGPDHPTVHILRAKSPVL
jgi:tetratricopeptide (TPR) repeat protein